MFSGMLTPSCKPVQSITIIENVWCATHESDDVRMRELAQKLQLFNVHYEVIRKKYALNITKNSLGLN